MPILLLCQKIGTTMFLYLGDAVVLASAYTQAKEDGQGGAVATEIGFVLSLKKSQLESIQEFAHPGIIFNTQNITLLIPKDEVLTIKVQAAKMSSSPTCRGVMRLLGLTNFASMALRLARLCSCPLWFWIKENCKAPADLFKGMKQDTEASHALHWWCTFKPQPKSICIPLTDEAVTTDVSKDGYGGHMNNLSFRGRWPAKKGRNTYINILEMETVWFACQKCEEAMREKNVFFQIDNTTAVAYLVKEGGTHCKTLNVTRMD